MSEDPIEKSLGAIAVAAIVIAVLGCVFVVAVM